MNGSTSLSDAQVCPEVVDWDLMFRVRACEFRVNKAEARLALAMGNLGLFSFCFSKILHLSDVRRFLQILTYLAVAVAFYTFN